jgi:hypothetical protein
VLVCLLNILLKWRKPVQPLETQRLLFFDNVAILAAPDADDALEFLRSDVEALSVRESVVRHSLAWQEIISPQQPCESDEQAVESKISTWTDPSSPPKSCALISKDGS